MKYLVMSISCVIFFLFTFYYSTEMLLTSMGFLLLGYITGNIVGYISRKDSNEKNN
jgi:hypothetical protein